MRISIKALSLTCALLWGGCMLVVGLVNLADPNYGEQFLRLMSSIYPGADTTRTIGRVLIGTVYGFVDGALCGLFFGWLYRAMFRTTHHAVH